MYLSATCLDRVIIRPVLIPVLVTVLHIILDMEMKRKNENQVMQRPTIHVSKFY